MPLFLVQTRKATQNFGGRKWSNRYYVDAVSATQALDKGEQLWGSVERPFHYEDTYCYEIYVNQAEDKPFTPGETRPLDPSAQSGLRDTLGQGDLMPEFCAVRVDFPVSGSRPSRKFYHPFLREADCNGNGLAASFLADLGTGLAGLAGIPGLRDDDNEPWAGTSSPRGITSRRLGKLAALAVPPPPTL